MLFCVSIIFKTKLPIYVIFNKEDTADSEKIIEWMKDYDKFVEALKEDEERYVSSLSKSMALSLDEFYKDLDYTSVSSITHKNFENVINNFNKIQEEFWKMKGVDDNNNTKE